MTDEKIEKGDEGMILLSAFLLLPSILFAIPSEHTRALYASLRTITLHSYPPSQPNPSHRIPSRLARASFQNPPPHQRNPSLI